MLARTAGLLLPFLAVGLAGPAPGADGPPLPPFPREFRAVWVATVGNIDWPSRPGLPPGEQRREALAILDRAATVGLNAVVLQVRPAADALYKSALEPWSYYLTGAQGRAPEPAYDPLAFWVEEAHRRGLLLHAWFNPFRARPDGARYEAAPGHVSRTRPDLTRTYGGLQWLDPGEPEAREQTLRVILDVVRRYDVDGVHLDDYFYPYPVADPAAPRGQPRELDFPDDPGWERYRQAGGSRSRADWRRSNINDLVRAIHERVRQEKPGVLFGISPFGIPRPGKPREAKGFDQYERLYADAVLWLNNGWCDYVSPQLYWKVDAPGQPFRPLLQEWIKENTADRHVWPGLSISRVNSGKSGYAPEEILRQIAILRETPGASGHVLFSMKALMQDRRGIARRLETEPYRDDALVPPTPWVDGPAPAEPAVSVTPRGGKCALDVRPGRGPAPFVWAVWVRRGEAWSCSTHPTGTDPILIDNPSGGRVATVAVAAVDRLGRASRAVTVAVTRKPTR